MMWDKELIQTLLKHSDKAVMRALMQLYRRQTASERQMQATTDANGVGFNYNDSKILSDIASRVPQYGRLTPRQTVLVRARLMKYWRQLAEIANDAEHPVPVRLLQLCGRGPVPPGQLLGKVERPEPTAAEVEDMVARAEEAEAVDAHLAQLVAAGMVAAGDCV